MPDSNSKYTVSSLDDAKGVMRASDLRMLIEATGGHPSRFAWAVLRVARRGQIKPRLAAALLHDGNFRSTSIKFVVRTSKIDLEALLRLFRGTTTMFTRDPDASIDLMCVTIDAPTFRPRFAQTASMPAPYVTKDGKGVMLVRQQPPKKEECNDGVKSSTIVTALLKPRDDCYTDGCSPRDAQAMRTVMTTTERSDGTLVVAFWPPVGAWIARDNDYELHVWLRLLGGRKHVDLIHEGNPSGCLQSRAEYPRLRKMIYHAPEAPLMASYMDEPTRIFKALAEVPLLSSWPNDWNSNEREYLQRLGEAHEVAKRHRAAIRIQAAWRKAVSVPENLVCRRRLLREFGILWTTLPTAGVQRMGASGGASGEGAGIH